MWPNEIKVAILLKHENDENYLKNIFFQCFTGVMFAICPGQYAKYNALIKGTCNKPHFEPLIIAVIAILIIWHQIRLDI